jgi:transcriptional regulator with XRE-family HTH domain
MHPIERYRKARGLTQAELAQRVGVSTNSVQGWEAGAEPRPRRLVTLAEALGIERLALLDEIEAWRQQHGITGKAAA